MAQDTFRIEINIDAEDNTSSGTKSASANMTAFEKSMQKTQDRLNKLTGGRWKVGLEAVDKATYVVDKVTNRVNSLVGKAWNFTMGVVDKVTSPVRGILNLLKNPLIQAGAVLGVSIGLKDTIDTYAAFESTMSKVGAVSGATAAEMSLLTDKAREMGASTKFTATEAGEAFSYMAMAGWKTEDMMSGIEGIMSLAAASGEDLATTSDIVTDALTAFGLKAADSAHFADVLAAASSNANTNVAMMGETFKYVAPIFGSLYGEGERAAKGMEDAALGIGLMANAGIKSTQAGTALRSILTRLSTNAGATKNSLGALDVLMQDLGVKFYDDAGAVRNFEDILMETRSAWAGLTAEQAASYAKTIAGQEAMSGWLAMMNAAPADVYKLTKAIQGADGAAKNMQDTMLDNLSGAMTLFQSAFADVKLTAGERFSPYLREFIEWMTGKLPALGDAVDRAFDRIDSKIADVRQTIRAFTSGEDWASADLFGKIRIVWDKLVAEPFSKWFSGKAESIGKALGSGITNTIKAVLGFDTDGMVDAGVSIGASLLRGFKEGFDLGEIWNSIQDWAGNHKILAVGIGSVLGLNLLSGLGNKLASLSTFVQLLGKPAQALGGFGSAAAGLAGGDVLGGISGLSGLTSAMTVNVTGANINVSGAVVNVNGGTGSLYRSGAKRWETIHTRGSGTANMPASELPNSPAIPEYVLQKNTGWTSVNSPVGKFLRLGSKEVDVKADGTLRSVEGGVGGALGGMGKAFGSQAATAAGAAAAGLASIVGIITAGATLVSSVQDFSQSSEYEKEENERAAEVSRGSGTMKVMGVGTGAAIGATIGSVVPVIGTGVGAAVGAGIGGLLGWLGGNKARENYEKEVTEKLKLEAVRYKEAATELEKHTLEQRQAKFASQELRDALADTSVTAEEFSKIFERTVTENIHGRFGELRLEAEEISAVVTQMLSGADYDGMTVFESAKNAAASAYQNIQDSMQGLDKLNWKIGLGLELDETELESWRAGLEGVYDSAKSYVENAHWEASAAVKLLVDPESDVDFSGLDEVYASIQRQIEGIATEDGKTYSACIKLALEDGVITLDEQAEIQSLQNQINEITDKVANIQATADMKALQIKYSGAALDYDSFSAFQAELENQVNSITSTYDEALKVGIASLELQLGEGAIDQAQYDAQLQALAEGYHGKISNLALEAEGFQLDAIVSAYGTELDVILPDLEGTTTERLQQALNAALAEDIDVTGLTSEQVAKWLGLDDKLAAETQGEITRLLQSVASTLPNETAASIAGAFEHADMQGAIEKTDMSGAYAGIATLRGLLETETQNTLGKDMPVQVPVTVTYNYSVTNPNPPAPRISGMDMRLSYQKGFANGGFVNGAELSWVGEDGPEAIIPLGMKRRGRGLELYEQVGEILGVTKNAEGGVYGGAVYNGGNDTRYGGAVYNDGNIVSFANRSGQSVTSLSNQYVNAGASSAYSTRNSLAEIQNTTSRSQPSTLTAVHNITSPSIFNPAYSTRNSLAEIQNTTSRSQPSTLAVHNAPSLSIFNSPSSQSQSFLDSAAYQSETRNAYSSFADMSQDAVSPETAVDGWQRADGPIGMFPETGGAFPDFDFSEEAGEAPPNPGWTAVSDLLHRSDGGGVVLPSGSVPQTAADTDSGGVTVEIHVEQHNEYNVDGKDLDEAKVVAIINAHALDNANELAQRLGKELMKALANRPAKGRA